MKKLPLILFCCLVVVLWLGLHRDPHVVPSPLINHPAPQFSAASLLSPKSSITEQIFQGKVTILNVFATWCEACQEEHSVLMEGRHDLHGIQIVGLDYKDENGKALAWLAQYGNPYDQVIADSLGDIGINFGVYGTPETFIIDKKGMVRDKLIGAITPAIWRQKLLPEINSLAK